MANEAVLYLVPSNFRTFVVIDSDKKIGKKKAALMLSGHLEQCKIVL